jgi:DNA-binding beta-propeller fold protein YncE
VAVAFDSKENEATSHEPRLEVIVNGPPAPSGIGFIDPLLIATLRWDQAPLAYGDFAASNNPAGSYPRGLAFDGSSVWVTNEIHNTVTKLRARDGAIIGTFAVGVRPIEAAFDGANLWVVCGNSVTKLRASDGARLGTFTAGVGPHGAAFDGANIWVTNSGNGTVTKLRAKRRREPRDLHRGNRATGSGL